MAQLSYGMSQSLDGYVDDKAGTLVMPPPDPAVFRHFTERVRGMAGVFYGRRIYEIMQYWDQDQPEWDQAEHDFAAAWRAVPKWVVSRTLTSVGPNATLVKEDLEGFVRQLKAEVEGELEVAGPELAGTMTQLGLIDTYHLYFRPFVLGEGKPFFTGPRPPLRLVATEIIGHDTVRLTYAV